jgi:hypothetical protein
MAKTRPGGASERILATMSPSQRSNAAMWALPLPDLTGTEPDYYEPFVFLPSSGLAASTRKLGDELVKLLVVGGPAKATHAHEDRGSFVLEFAGDTFAADPGGMPYSDSLSPSLKYAQNHNMLVPQRANGPRPSAGNPAPQSVIPGAQGDESSFFASINPGVLWPDYYETWKREFRSETPESIVITDSYTLTQGDGVEFLWHTPLPVSHENGTLILTGERGRAIITPPEGAEIEISPARKLGMRSLSTVKFRVDSSEGRLATRVRLDTLN